MINKKKIVIEELERTSSEIADTFFLVAAHEEKETFNYKIISVTNKLMSYNPVANKYRVVINKKEFNNLSKSQALETYNGK